MITRSVQNFLKPILDTLKEGDIIKSYSLLEEVLQDNLDNPELNFLLRVTDIWKEKLRTALAYSSAFERGEYMVSQWKPFLNYVYKSGEYKESIIYALKFCVFKLAMSFYNEVFKETPNVDDAELYRKVGLCYKALGNYEKAVDFLRYAMNIDENFPAVLAELADSYAMCGETKLAKIFFREAFFKDPSKIELQFLESDIICSITEKLAKAGYKDGELLEWIPVYGVLDGVFNIKRELRALELGSLRQKIFLLESEFGTKPEYQRRKDIPRLINYYFWLIDHYINTNDNNLKIDELLLKIKILNEDIYNSYIK